jgi:hypothetical protein
MLEYSYKRLKLAQINWPNFRMVSFSLYEVLEGLLLLGGHPCRAQGLVLRVAIREDDDHLLA